MQYNKEIKPFSLTETITTTTKVIILAHSAEEAHKHYLSRINIKESDLTVDSLVEITQDHHDK